MRRPGVGVMVARGDLAVEAGFSRLSELQEEMLWLAQAADVPLVWATQVLESIAKGGVPSRGDVTDAAAAGRAEAVMLNKGRHMDATLGLLSDVLARAEGHVDKRRHTLRALSVAAGRGGEGVGDGAA